ncbi:conserved hypothetical protein [Aeromonas veronii]|uniref:Uncharacterized protein n=1 Tax=Aeromonas veronii TaxID=654 RepID=A0A653L792_AERVE|nr:conserved hypothetical protein [Aeromonas veronii]
MIHTTLPWVLHVNQEPGGATRDRTADLLHAMQALSQLSYNPFDSRLFEENLVELRGIEPRTSCMPCKRSPS